ncbi:MAG: NADH-quinone oxidoreductase subunit N [Thermoleophilia bacterium]
MSTKDLIAILPELILVAAGCLVLVVEPFLRKDKTAVVTIAVTALSASGVVGFALAGETRAAFSHMVVLNDFAVFFKVLFAAAGVITVFMSPRYLESHGRHLGEYYALLLFAVVGMDLMAAARDLMAFYVGLELMAVSSYLLAGFFRYHARSNEAALKYFLTGSFASAITLYGLSLVYGFVGATNYQEIGQALQAGGNTTGVALATALVVVGTGFKVSIAPFHMWTPDVYEGAPTPVAGFFSVGPKAAGLSAMLMLFLTVFDVSRSTWSVLFIVLAVLTMAVGNLFALVQKNVKRMLAYSSIAHVGYLAAGLGALGRAGDNLAGEAVLFYLAAYTFMNLGAFAVLAYLKTQQPGSFAYSLADFAGLARRSPWAAVLMSLFLFSLTGIPGTAGFAGKFYLFNAVVRADLVWLAVVAVLFSAVSAYYYLRVMVYMFFREPEREYAVREPISGSLAASLALCTVGVVLIGLLPGSLWDAAVSAFGNFFG